MALFDFSIVCRIDLTQCEAKDVPPTETVCLCLANRSNTYDLYVRVVVEAEKVHLSEKVLSAEYKAQLFFINGITQSKDLGKIPIIFGK